MTPLSSLRIASALGIAALAGSLASSRPAVAQEYGTIKGRLVWGGKALPDAAPKVKKDDAAVKDPAVCAVADVPNEDYVVDPATKGVANGVAYLVNPSGSNPEAEKALLEKTPEVIVDQKNCRFIPHVVVVHKDQTLVFKSSDAVSHNVKYLTVNNDGGNQMVPNGGRLPVKFAKAERNMAQFECNIHPWMNGWFMVLDNPYFALTKPDGSFEITGVPVGKQRLIVRQEKVGYVTKGARQGIEIDVKPGENNVGEFVLTLK